ncbi:hypothetical protein L5515_015375 [Caenorhabditis briggsae]|uniref:Uncharacterized protein n=1 Tax=Caenorhabditis briggsae TaxID=6238 RepID=A0AAE9EES1_CAEBR|nr:hypothetical protein L5515_015375 [Caenorhabditis briggsae]
MLSSSYPKRLRRKTKIRLVSALSCFYRRLFYLFRTGAKKKEKGNDGEKPNRKTPEKDQQILKRKIENRAQRKTGRDAARAMGFSISRDLH